jgi:hypothetical protein
MSAMKELKMVSESPSLCSSAERGGLRVYAPQLNLLGGVSIVELDVIRLRSTGGECCTLGDGDIVIAANERQVFKSQKKDEEPTLKWVWRRMSGHYCGCCRNCDCVGCEQNVR